MEPQATVVYTPSFCARQRLRLSKQLLNSPHKALAQSYERKLGAYRTQGTAYGLLLSASFISLAWTRFRALKMHIPGIITIVALSGFVGALVGVKVGSKYAIEELGRIAEDKELDELRTQIIENCARKVRH